MELRQNPLEATPGNERQDDLSVGHRSVLSRDSNRPPEDAPCGVHPEQGAIVTCHRCGTYACDGCLFSRAGRHAYCHACAAAGLPEPVPWERRAELGRVRAFLDTSRVACLEPSRFSRTPRAEAGIGWAVAYGVFAYGLGQLLMYLLIALGLLIGGGSAALLDAPELGAGLGMAGCFTLGMSPFVVLQAPFYALAGIIGGGALSHGTLALFKKTRAPFEDTIRLVAYANAPYVLYAVPLVGALVTPFWVMAIEANALRALHGVSGPMAWLAVAGYRLLLVGSILALYVAIVAFAFLAEDL